MISMYPGDKKKLKISISPAKGTSKSIVFKSTNPKVVSVSKKGKIKCKKSGNATIIAKANDGSKKKAKIKIKVGYRVQNIVVINGFSTDYLRIDQRVKLNILVLPSCATNPSVDFSSSKPDVVEVTDDGILIPKKVGWVTIKIKAKDGSKVFTKKKFKVVNPVETVQIQSIKKTPYGSKQKDGSYMLMKGSTITFTTKVDPVSATDKSLEWKVSDENVATIENGVLTAKKDGEVIVRAIAKDFKKCSTSVKVKVTSCPRGGFSYISHRGETALAPENSVAAVKLALEGKYDGVEIDVRVTSDGEFVLSHDDTLKRMCDVDEKISNMTLQEVCSCKLKNGIVNSNYSNEYVPTLVEVLDILQNHPKKTMYIEMKDEINEEQTEKLLGIIVDKGLENQIRIATIHETVVASVRELSDLGGDNISIDYICFVPNETFIEICKKYNARMSLYMEYMTSQLDKVLCERGLEYAVWCPQGYESFCKKRKILKFSACTMDAYYCTD